MGWMVRLAVKGSGPGSSRPFGSVVRSLAGGGGSGSGGAGGRAGGSVGNGGEAGLGGRTVTGSRLVSIRIVDGKWSEARKKSVPFQIQAEWATYSLAMPGESSR